MIKRFGGVLAVDKVDLDVFAGEVLALVGDNGAGKSTLIQTISGVFRADGGELFLEGERQVFNTPEDARRAGIETIYQDLALCDNLTPATSPWARIPKRRLGLPASTCRRCARRRGRCSTICASAFPSSTPASSLAAASGQRSRAPSLAGASRSWTSHRRARRARATQDGLIRMLKTRVPVILISHNMGRSRFDRICVMRRGLAEPHRPTESNEIVRTDRRIETERDP
jgi:simple sugar transport system ATP-binding protein